MVEITPELAEICGIHAGDGYLRGPEKRCELDISGNIEEKEYYDIHVKELFKKAFNTEINCRYFPYRNTYGFVIRDKEKIKFMHELGFPYGNKSTIIKIPEFILNSEDITIKRNFLRGLFDTDGCLYFKKRQSYAKYCQFKKSYHYYPAISFVTVSKNLIDDLAILLKNLGFLKFGTYKYVPKKDTESIRYTIVLYGVDYANKFFDEIGSKNPVKSSRFLLWKKIGHCPPNTTLSERTEMLKSPVS